MSIIPENRNQRLAAHLLGPEWYIHLGPFRDGYDGGLIRHMQSNEILTHAELPDLIRYILRGYQYITPDEIEEINADIQHEIECQQWGNSTPRPKPQSKPGYVYIITDGQYYKVGISQDPEARLKQFQTSNANHLHLVHTRHVPRPKELEEHVHALLSQCNMRGEWFELTQSQVKEAIDAIEGWEVNA